ncbi:unnamed protein product [Urochloa decumbens]|uniref:RING-type E3 ubiquitin transferase n=1 Tax=Urochloa decumbens TaxID=240449 RepID=A0ABC9E8X1_9POAL
MPLKLVIILLLLLPVCGTCAVLKLAGLPWPTTGAVAAVLLVFVAAIGIFINPLRLRPSRWQQQPAVESTGAPPQEAAVLGLGASAIANLPVHIYKKKSSGVGDECSVCLGEVKPKETVKQLPICAHLFHEGCIDVWLRSHGTCPVCRSPVNAAAAAAVPASVEIVVHTNQAN